MRQPPRVRHRAALIVVGLLVAVPAERAAAAVPLDPPEPYRARGEATVTIDGADCCAGTTLTARFDTAYTIDPSGAVTIQRLALAVDDANVVVRGGFLGLFSERIWLRCGTFGLQALAHGSVGAPDRLDFPVGAVTLGGFAAQSREPSGECPGATLELAGSNSATLRITHKPAADVVGLDATLLLDSDGTTYTMRVQGNGRFTNRPPRAALAFRYPDGTFPQGGCPAFPYWNGQQWEQVAEANGPAGLRAGLLSYSSDPDGTWGAADVLNDQWFDTRGLGARQPLASGRDVAPLLFGWGTAHRVELLALDHTGAADVASCTFRVADTRPPRVVAPPPLVTGCSTAGGATRATSPALSAFLAAASATDVVDTTPTALPAQVAGVDVTPTTLFPANGTPRAVRFRFRDDVGQVGSADGNVTVVDVIPPTLTVAVSPAVIPPTLALYAITATPLGSDACGAVIYRLKSITSNAPAFDAADIVGAALGTDDRAFQLRGRPAASGVDRIYKIVYQAIDAAGNATNFSAVVTARAH